MEKVKQNVNNIAIIGAGHMGKALLAGMLFSGKVDHKNLIISNPSGNHLLEISRRYNIRVTKNNNEAISNGDIIILCVKPATVHIVKEFRDMLVNKIFISVVAGISLQELEKFTSKKQKIIRIMPNIPVAFGEGVIGYKSNNSVNSKTNQAMVSLFSLLGKVIICDSENLLDIMSLIPGCGPALVSYLIELFANTMKSYGLDNDIANQVALQIYGGTIAYLKKTGISPLSLQQSVATKGGITEQIIEALNSSSFRSDFIRSITKGLRKIKKIGPGLENK